MEAWTRRMAAPYGHPMNNLVRVVLAVLVAAAAVPMFAEPADFSISLLAGIQPPATHSADRIAVGEIVYYQALWSGTGDLQPGVVFEVGAPGVVTHVLAGAGMTCTTPANPIRCMLNEIYGQHGSFQFGVRVDGPGTYTTTARVIHPNDTHDVNPLNDAAAHTFQALALPSLALSPTVTLERLAPGTEGVFGVNVVNRAATPATNVVLTVTLPAGGTFVSGGPLGAATCTIESSNVLVCRVASIAQDQYLSANVTFTAPSRMDGADLIIAMSVTSAEEDLDPSDNSATARVSMIRQFVVNNVNDEGGGSLRQAIHDVNALCAIPQPCAILFQIPAPVPESGWFTILPHTPFPEIEATLELDGATQTQFTGDTNPDGPEIEIDGALVKEEAGLRLRPNCDIQVRNLAVNRFPGYGIVVRRDLQRLDTEPCFINSSIRLSSNISNNYLGTDPRGRVAKPNQRGLGLFTFTTSVHDNVISGNRRAGVYVENGFYADISRNKIGVGADGSPLGNGAGIFLNTGNVSFGIPGGADVTDNVIAYNAGMAIARTRVGQIYISHNSMFDNLQQGIDVDLDGVSAQRADENDVPNAPTLFEATYIAGRDETVVRGRIDSDAFGHTHAIEIYASSRLSGWGTSQAEQSVIASSILTGHETFEVAVPGDLRGKWITATYGVARYVGFVRSNPRGIATQSHSNSMPANTSELSNAVMTK